jgi:hypothetical protein
MSIYDRMDAAIAAGEIPPYTHPVSCACYACRAPRITEPDTVATEPPATREELRDILTICLAHLNHSPVCPEAVRERVRAVLGKL